MKYNRLLRKKYKNKLWGDLKSDREKYEFLLSGRSVDTGIIAPALLRDVIRAYSVLVEPANLHDI